MLFSALSATVTIITAVAYFGAITNASPLLSNSLTSACSKGASTLYLSDPPHDNYFYSDCNSSSHIIVTTPRSGSDLNIVKPRLLVAWPAGNSGALALFAPEDGQTGTLEIHLKKSFSSGEDLDPIKDSQRVGVSGTINFNTAARLTVPILGSIRTIRDFTEGGSTNQDFQGNFGFALHDDGGATINRTWLDGVTTTWLTFSPLNGAAKIILNREAAWTLTFGAGDYRFEASMNYPQLDQLEPGDVLNDAAPGLIAQTPDQTTSLSFLSYSDKMLAGTWRFLTYFGRDSMISMLLMQPILSEVAIEAVIASVLERVNFADGTVCHEEVLGDYATWLNHKDGIKSSKPRCDYKMIDTDYLLPIAMKNYLADSTAGKQRAKDFLSRTASFLEENKGVSYMKLAQSTAEKIMRKAAPFANKQVKENLIHLNDGEAVGEWRDSNNGLGGGRIPYDVNVALVPAGLRAIAALSRAGFFPDHPDWSDVADRYAQIWEDSTLHFFEITVPKSHAISLVQSYASSLSVPPSTEKIDSDITYHGLALDGAVGGSVVPVMNTDDCFRHFLVDSTNQTQLSGFLSQTADHILQPFPVGLASDVGLFVANPAYAGNAGFADGFSRDDYHGTVVWSWQLAMMGAGLSRQLRRCASNDVPDFCTNKLLYAKITTAYNRLWDIIDANKAQLSHEVWSWRYDNGFKAVPLGDYITTESNVRQLWSLTFLAVRREKF